MSFDWKKLLEGAAPMLATAFLGPAGGVASKLLVDALDPGGKTDPNDPKQLDALMSKAVLDPASVVKIKQAEMDFQAHMAELGYKDAEALAGLNLEAERIGAKDRDSARAREVASHDAWTPRVLGGLVVFGFLWCLYFVLSGRVQGLKSPEAATIIGSLIGYASAKADMVISYYFGSSSGSQAKDRLLFNSTPIDSSKK